MYTKKPLTKVGGFLLLKFSDLLGIQGVFTKQLIFFNQMKSYINFLGV